MQKFFFPLEALGSERVEYQKSKFYYGASSTRRINLLELQNIVVHIIYMKYTFVKFRYCAINKSVSS